MCLNKMMKEMVSVLVRTGLVLLLILICEPSFSQGFKVKEFKQNLNDGSAFHAPIDAEGHPCGLIKVRSSNPDLEFEGEVVGDVEMKMNEYWVYISQASTSLKIVHPNYLPLVLSLADYGISISSKATYILTIEEQNFKKEKTGLTVIVKPENAAFYVNKVLIGNSGGNGLYQLYLPKGDYVCELKKDGYRSHVQMIQTGKASQEINVELESLMAELEVKCKTTTAEIYIDGNLKGNGTWKGELSPGDHKIEARQQNYASFSKSITLSEKETRFFAIPELERLKGTLMIKSIPSGLPLWVDGDSVGITPCTVNAETGVHHILCQADGCEPYREEIVVNPEKDNQVIIKMRYDDGAVGTTFDYQKAYNGDQEAILQLICNACHFNNMRFDIAFYWVNRHPAKEDLIFRWHEYGRSRGDALWGWWMCPWVRAFEKVGAPEKAKKLRSQLERLRNTSDDRLKTYLDMNL